VYHHCTILEEKVLADRFRRTRASSKG